MPHASRAVTAAALVALLAHAAPDQANASDYREQGSFRALVQQSASTARHTPARSFGFGGEATRASGQIGWDASDLDSVVTRDPAAKPDIVSLLSPGAARHAMLAPAPAPETRSPVASGQSSKSAPVRAQSSSQNSSAGVSLEEANQAIANPLAQATLAIQEFNTVFLDGDLLDDSRVTGIYAIDPLIPIPLTSKWNMVLRPIIPFAVGADLPVSGGSSGPASGGSGLSFENQSGMGDISFFTLFTPNNEGNFKYGAGPAFRFPTATDDRLGAEKFSVGAATVGLYSSPNFSIGMLNQNYFSVAGEDSREDVSTSTFQYFAFYNFTPEWGIGTAPTISVDWTADEDKLLLPVGMGIAHTFRIGAAPARLLLEGQYYAVQRDAFGPEWNLRVALAIFLPAPIKNPIFE